MVIFIIKPHPDQIQNKLILKFWHYNWRHYSGCKFGDRVVMLLALLHLHYERRWYVCGRDAMVACLWVHDTTPAGRAILNWWRLWINGGCRLMWFINWGGLWWVVGAWVGQCLRGERRDSSYDLNPHNGRRLSSANHLRTTSYQLYS